MSYSETIDNINDRIENIISDRLPQTYQHITIEPSDYNPTIDDDITVTITVKDQSDTPVSGFTVPLQINGESITGLVTNSSGIVTYTYTCDEWGTVKFAVKSYTAFINVTGLKHVVYNDQYQYWYDDHNVYLAINTGSDTVSFPTVFTEFGVQRFIPEALRPKERIVVQPFTSNNLFVAVSVDGGIYRRSATGSSVNSVLMAYLQWHY